MPAYFEFAPPPHLADAVECIWSLRNTEKSGLTHRVLPDGCADILFKRAEGRGTLQVVGPMTKFEDFPIPQSVASIGIRFRPGMWAGPIGVPADIMTDEVIPLEDLWGARGRILLGQLRNAKSVEDSAMILTQSLRVTEARTPVQRAIAWIEQQRGIVPLDDAARHAGISARQFRRTCLRQTGLSPKFLMRVQRFRHVLSKLRSEAGGHAALAAECGYTDQSHFISEFRQFSGQTPSAYLRSHV